MTPSEGKFVLSAIQDKLSWSLGYNFFDTDGWRDNADQDDKIANAFVQYELTYKTSIQAEFRYRETENGDIQMRFFEDDFLPDLSEDKTTQTARVGFRHSFSPGSDLIGNFQYQKLDGDVEDEPAPDIIGVGIDTDADAYGAELQYLFRSEYINLIPGAGYYDIDSKDNFTTELLTTTPPTLVEDVTLDGDVKHTNVYLYSYINLPANVTLTVGGSYDDFDSDGDDTPDKDKFNPKFGVTWNPFPNTTLRGAAFRVLKRTLITDQTLEPTQVAGFNQFYDDVNATDSWRYGGAVDQKFTQSIYGGAEYTYRDLNVPYSVTTGPSTFSLENGNWDEKIFRAYLFWTPHEWVALRAEYLWERFEREEEFADGANTLETSYVPLGINFFHPIGVSAGLTGTYVDQQGSFERQGTTGTFENGDDNFFLVDAAIKYRFPKRYGFFTIGVSNLFDEDFEHFDTDEDNPRFQPDRFFYASFTLAVP